MAGISDAYATMLMLCIDLWLKVGINHQSPYHFDFTWDQKYSVGDLYFDQELRRVASILHFYKNIILLQQHKEKCKMK